MDYKSSDKTLLFSVISAFVAVGFLVGFIYSKYTKTSSSNYPTYAQQKNTTSGKMVDVLLSSDDTAWAVNKPATFDVLFAEAPNPFPTVFTLYILYDPEVLEATTASPGNLWSDSNVLETEIDSVAGRIAITIGQGFTSDVTGALKMASVSFTPLKAGATSISLDGSSQIAFEGVGSNLQSQPFEVTVK